MSKIDGGSPTPFIAAEDILPALDQPYVVELEAISNTLTASVFDTNGDLLHTLTVKDTDNPLTSGFSGLAADLSQTTFPSLNDNNDSTFDNFSSQELSVPELETDFISGTPNADILRGGIEFDAVNDIIFAGAGGDAVDTSLGGILAGNNRIFTGSDNDLIDVADGDRAFGGTGDDTLDASNATSYRISGGAGDDEFHLGADGRALGGEGDDIFDVLEGGGNIIAGGEGADQFWILSDNPNELSTPNTITDFEIGVDVIGIQNQGADFGFDDLILGGNDIMIGGTTIATLSGFDTSSLTAADFVIL
ncbi:MAG: hypothetical protein F6K62_22075 [Sphaerospermopsis sp. SIO1G2]|nr:hypothetical protein [Sphaerospermopsis sp. SIO1G2]